MQKKIILTYSWVLLWASHCFFYANSDFLPSLHWRDEYIWFYVFKLRNYKTCAFFANPYELVFQCACMIIFPNVCLVFVCKVSRSSSVCVSRLPLLQKAHFLPTTPAFFYCSSASLQSFPFLLISMMFPFISSTFSFTPHITHVWLFSFNSITPHICKLLRKGDSCFIVFHLSLLLHI